MMDFKAECGLENKGAVERERELYWWWCLPKFGMRAEFEKAWSIGNLKQRCLKCKVWSILTCCVVHSQVWEIRAELFQKAMVEKGNW